MAVPRDGAEDRDPRRRVPPEEIEWVEDGHGFVSWKRGWPEFLGRGHYAVAIILGLLGAAGLGWAGLGPLVAVTGAWFLTLCVLLLLSDALGRILPDRFIILATAGVALGWGVDALVSGDPALVLRPLALAAMTCLAFLALMGLPVLLSGGRSEGLGAGDVKVCVPLALWLGRWGGAVVLGGFLAGTLLAGLWVLALLLVRRIGLHGTIALGPWLVAGTLLLTGGVAALTAGGAG